MYKSKSNSCSLQQETKERCKNPFVFWMDDEGRCTWRKWNGQGPGCPWDCLSRGLWWLLELGKVSVLQCHTLVLLLLLLVCPCKHSCLKGSGVFRDSSVGVFTVKPSVNWMWLNDFSHLHHSCSVDKSRMCCLQPLESTAPRVQGKIKLKCQWVTWLPEGVHEYMEVFWAEVGWRNWGCNIDVSKII